MKTKSCPTTATVTYTSSDASIATVDQKGEVTPVKAGKVVIQAKNNYGSTALLTLDVISANTVKSVEALNGAQIKITFNAPKDTQSVYFNIPKQYKDVHKTDYNQNEHICTWFIPKIVGGNETTLDVKFTLQVNKPNLCRRELGPLVMSFEIPNYNVSHMQIKELKVMSSDPKSTAQRWVRIFTKAKSYVTRIS